MLRVAGPGIMIITFNY